MTEGYVKYSADHTPSPPPDHPRWKELNDVRTRLHDLGLLGINSDGIGFGNVSLRFKGGEFLISGTSTGGPRILGADFYCLVTAIDIDNNSVVTKGPVKASAESMTHGAIYLANPAVNCVLHIHSRKIFDAMLKGAYPSTPPEAEYGTPEIARAIFSLVQKEKKDAGVIVLAGHDEGVIAFGDKPDDVYKLTENLYNTFGK